MLGIIERGDTLRLRAETLHVVSVARQSGRQHLDGDRPLELQIEATIDLCHAARAE